MSYVTGNLLKNEKVIYSARPHWVVFYPCVGWALLYFFVLLFGKVIFISPAPPGISSQAIVEFVSLVFAVSQGIKNSIYYLASEYAITNQRVLVKLGWIKRRSFEIFLKQIEGIEVNQDMVARTLNYGAVVITGIGGSKNVFNYIPKPLSFRKAIQQQIALPIEQVAPT